MMDPRTRNLAIGGGVAVGLGLLLFTRKASAGQLPAPGPGPDGRYPAGLEANLPILRAAAARYGVPLPVVLAVAHYETAGSFDPYSEHPSDGPPIWRRYKRDNPHVAGGKRFNQHAAREEPNAWGSKGLMQTILATALAMGLPWDAPWRAVFDPAVSADLGVKRLAQLHRRHGNWQDALAAYNSGRPMASAPEATRTRYVPNVSRLSVGYEGTR